MSLPEPFSQTSGEPAPLPLGDQVVEWLRTEGAWWASSFVFHMFLMCSLMLIGITVRSEIENEAPTFDEAIADVPVPTAAKSGDIEDEAPGLDPDHLDPNLLTLGQGAGPTVIETKEVTYDDNPVFSEQGGGRPMEANGPSLGGMGGFSIEALGPGIAVHGEGGVGTGVGTGTNPGSGGPGIGFGGRGTGMRKSMLGGYGGTKRGERAVALALKWLAQHQSRDGRWSLAKFTEQCSDRSCACIVVPDDTGTYDTAGTAFGLLPFLAAGQTHQSKGPYKENVQRALHWLMAHQKEDGDLTAGGSVQMYAHGLASIALCEAYGMTRDKQIGERAQRALRFIESAQHEAGGWRYNPKAPGDTSVSGWQLMALKSGQMAGLSVSGKTLEYAKNFLKSVSGGQNGGLFRYIGTQEPSDNMTAVGLLCNQYLGMGRSDPAMIEGIAYFMAHFPQAERRNLYYWYYATQALHNVPGPEWDKWNRQIRRILIESQIQEGCATGSWGPANSNAGETWTSQGGRIMMTSLATLTLEVYYRFLPLYKLDNEAAPGDISIVPPKAEPAKAEAAPKP